MPILLPTGCSTLTRRASFEVALFDETRVDATALKGRNKHGHVEYCAPSGLHENFDVTPTQGVALGWLIAAPSGRKRKRRNIKTRERGQVVVLPSLALRACVGN